MRLNFKKIKQASVETASGIKLGRVSDIMLDTEGQLVAQYVVKHSIISDKTYLISREQIVRFEDKKIIVDDNVSRDVAQDPKFTSGENSITNSEPISIRKSA